MDDVANPDTLTGPVPVRGPEPEPEGFDALFLREFPRVARTLHHIVGDRGRAEEVTQDAFIELLRNWGKVSRYDRPDLWVRRVAIRKAQRERHRSWRRVELERGTHDVGGSEPPTPTPEVLAAVRGLAPKQRAAGRCRRSQRSSAVQSRPAGASCTPLVATWRRLFARRSSDDVG